MNMPRVAFFFQYSYIETIPFIREPIMQLAAEGVFVDLFAPLSKKSPEPNFAPYNVQVISCDFKSRRAVSRLLASIPKIALTRGYKLLLANPIEALICGAIVAKLIRVPLIAFSDELHTEEDFPISPRRRRLMNWAHRRAIFTVITDRIRSAILRNATGLPESHTFYELPNSPSGIPTPVNKRELRDRINVPCDATVLMMSGLFATAMGNDLLLNVIPRLPDNTYLVFQFNVRGMLDDDIVALCKLTEKKYPVRFLFDPLPYDCIDHFVGSGDIGVVFYNSRGPNFDLCGKGSGKLCRFLRLGKPVIVNRQGSLEWVAEYGAGEVANSPEELIKAIQKIGANYEKYEDRALSCYQEYFAFEKYYPPIHRAMRELILKTA
jgi:glycosyltransferase involved in cell wall biosynthesis